MPERRPPGELMEWWDLVMSSDLDQLSQSLIMNEITQDHLRKTLAPMEANPGAYGALADSLIQACRAELRTAQLRRESIELSQRQRYGTAARAATEPPPQELDEAAAVEEPPTPLAEGAVELRGYFKYDSGSPYRIWTFTRDVPELPALGRWIEDVAGPPHALAGDELYEDREDGGRVFRLKRDDLVIGRPEWWQVGDLVFDGVWPAWGEKAQESAAGAPAADPDEATVARVLPRGLRKLGNFSSHDPRGSVLVAGSVIPGTRVEAGDVVFLRRTTAGAMSKAERSAIRGTLIRMPRETAPLLADAIDEGRLRLVSDSSNAPASGVAKRLRTAHKRYVGRGRTWKDSTSPLFILRPARREQVSEPIVAARDEAAIFSLIHDAGGRMPEGGDDA